MTHRIRRVAVLASLASLVAVPALAVEPVPDSRYAGETSQRGELRFEFRTSEDGTRVERLFTQFRARRCELAENGTQGSIRVQSIAIEDDGTFFRRGKETARLKPSGSFAGGTQIERYRIRGRFPTSETARGRLRVTVEVRNKAGETIDTCRMGKRRVTWSADRLGVGPEAAYELPG
jgi:hypothetical protein